MLKLFGILVLVLILSTVSFAAKSSEYIYGDLWIFQSIIMDYYWHGWANVDGWVNMYK